MQANASIPQKSLRQLAEEIAAALGNDWVRSTKFEEEAADPNPWRHQKSPLRSREKIPLGPKLPDSPSVTHVVGRAMEATGAREGGEHHFMRMENLGEILTPEELADRLKVSVNWIYEKRRPRCPKPIPAIPMGRTMRFDWAAIVKWLEELAADDARDLQERRTGGRVRRAFTVRKKMTSQSSK